MKIWQILSVGALTALIAGCGNDQSCCKESIKENKLEIQPYRATPYEEVSKVLNPGGDYYMVFSAEQVMKKIGEFFGKLEALAEIGLEDKMPKTIPGVKSPKEIFSIIKKVSNNTGITEIYGMGISSVPVSENVNHVRGVITHKPGEGKGLLWKIKGQQPHSLDDLKLLPKDTVYAGFTDLDFNVLYKWLDQQVKLFGEPALAGGLTPFVEMIKAQTQIDLVQTLASTKGQFGVVLTLDPQKKMTIKDPKQKVEFSAPNVAVMIKVKDQTIFNLLNKQFPPAFPRKEVKGVKTISIPVPPSKEVSGITIAPVITQLEDMLIFSLNSEIVDEMMQARSTGGGLVQTTEFKSLTENMPGEGNGFEFVSGRLMKEIQHFLELAVDSAKGKKQNLKQREMVKKIFLSSFEVNTAYSVNKVDSKGIHMYVNTSKDAIGEICAAVTIIPAAYIGIVSAIAIPAVEGTIGTAMKLKKLEELEAPEAIAVSFQPIRCKVADSKGERFLTATLRLEVENKKVVDFLDQFKNEKNREIVRAKVTQILSNKPLLTLLSRNGKEMITREIRLEVNKLLTKKQVDGKVLDAFFTEFLVQ